MPVDPPESEIDVSQDGGSFQHSERSQVASLFVNILRANRAVPDAYGIVSYGSEEF